MLKEHGIVVEIKGEFAVIQTNRANSCISCAANKGCGTAGLSTIVSHKNTFVNVINHSGISVGDKVIISMDSRALLKSVLVLYLFPLLGMFVGALGGDMLTVLLPFEETLTVLASFLGLIVGLKLAKRVTDKMSENTHYQPAIIKTSC